jgi:CheY-like chemotaxis protein
MIQTFKVLMADNSEDDRLLMRLAFRDYPRLNIVGEVETGEQVLAYLLGTGTFQDRRLHPFPDLLLLDLHMPRFDGFEVLAWLQTHSFPGLRVVVLSGSLIPREIAKTIELGADDYHIKSPSREHRLSIARGLDQLMGETVENPATPAS